jgi:hypothetical protein
MNIFYVHHDTVTCAQMHLDKHVVKMIVEYAQLLSTAHRLLDGIPVLDLSDQGRKRTRYKIPDERENEVYLATHVNHPSAVWVRKSSENYKWLYSLFTELLAEYTYRYGKIHACSKLIDSLSVTPKNIPVGPFTEPPPAMPDEHKVKGNSIESYRNFYAFDKIRFARWTKRDVPQWLTARISF